MNIARLRNSAMDVAAAVSIITCLICSIVAGSNPYLIEDNGTLPDGYSIMTHHPQRGEFFRKLIVTTILEQPYMMLKPHSPYLAGNDRFEGYLADILLMLAASAGFEYEIRLAKDGKYGELSDKGQWDGMIGEILAEEADIAAGAIIVTDDKKDFVDFTEPFLSLRSSALLRKSKSKRKNQRIGTVDQLVASDVPYGVVQNGPAHRILEKSSDPMKRRMRTRIKQSGFVRSVQEGIDRSRRENFAFILDSPMAEYVATRKPCDLYASDPFLDVMLYAFVTRKDDVRLRGVIDKELQKMKLGDEMQAMYLRWWRDECDDSVSKVDDASPEPKRYTLENKSPTVVRSGSMKVLHSNDYAIIHFVFLVLANILRYISERHL